MRKEGNPRIVVREKVYGGLRFVMQKGDVAVVGSLGTLFVDESAMEKKVQVQRYSFYPRVRRDLQRLQRKTGAEIFDFRNVGVRKPPKAR